MPRPIDRATANLRRGKPGIVRVPAAPRFPDRYPETLRDGSPHPKAGQAHPRAGQVVRNVVEFIDSDTGQRVVRASTGPVFWNADGTAVDDELTAGPAGFVAAGKPELGFGFRLRGNGGFVYEDDDGVIEVGAPEWLSPTGYRVLPLTRRRRVENRVEWDTPQGRFIIAVKGGLVITELHAVSVGDLTGWRFSISKEPPNLRRGRYENGFIVYDPPMLDGSERFPLTVGL